MLVDVSDMECVADLLAGESTLRQTVRSWWLNRRGPWCLLDREFREDPEMQEVSDKFTYRWLRGVPHRMQMNCKAAPWVIGTHDGYFHLDEVLAVYMLRTLVPWAKIVRSRDPARLAGLQVLVDVGGEYDHARHRYDHHQISFQETMHSLSGGRLPWLTRLSSAGLVYFHYGYMFLAAAIPALRGAPPADRTYVYEEVYRRFVEGVDAGDNGVPQYAEDAKPAYQQPPSLASRVSALNQEWTRPYDHCQALVRFQQAMVLAGGELLELARHIMDAELPARAAVRMALRRRLSDPGADPRIIEIAECPWREHLSALEAEGAAGGAAGGAVGGETGAAQVRVLYGVYPDRAGQGWRVLCATEPGRRFASRRPLPTAWRGLSGEALQRACGVPDATFVHAAGFIGGALSREGAMELVRRALSPAQ